MLKNNYICALDIGSSKISAVAAEIRKKRVVSLHFESLPSKGIRNGLIVDSVSLLDAIGKCLKDLQAGSGFKIKFIYTNVSGQDIISKHSRAIIPLAERGNKVITPSDVRRVNEQAFILGSNIDEENIHKMPYAYSVDDKIDIANPIGLYGHRLEVDLYLICVKLSSIQTLVHTVNQSGYEIRDLFLTGLVSAKAVMEVKFKAGVHVFCDMGSDITEILLFRDGILKNIEVLPLGGNDLTQELSNQLNIPFDLAEEIKVSYGIIGDIDGPGQDKEILLRKEGNYKPIKQKIVSEIITSKSISVCRTLKNILGKYAAPTEIKLITACGRGTLQEGFLEMFETILGVPVELGRITHPEVASFINRYNELSGQKYLAYTACLGMICQAMSKDNFFSAPAAESSHNPITNLINKVQEVYQEYF
ncbi:MAG: cell division protein FtsA [Candidatus Omnitrophota bacterium]